MKKKLLVIFILVSFFAVSQNSLKGTIKNKENGQVLPGATIFLPDLKTGVATDAAGTYSIGNLPKGKFLIECKVIGFNTTTRLITIEGETTLDLEIEESAVEIQEVTVTGSSQSTELKDNPVPMTIINSGSLFENTSTNLIDNISKEPGVNQISTGAGISKPVIRGLGYNRIVTLNNNIRQEGQQWGDEHGIEIDEYSIDRVEIIKGPGSLMYGSDAIAGVVNFLPPYPLPQGQVKGSVLMNYQTNNALKAFSANMAGNLKGISWLFRGSAKNADSYQNKYDGFVYNSGFSELDVNGSIGVNKKWGYSHFGFSIFDQTISMTEGNRDSLGNFTRLEKINDSLVAERTVPKNALAVFDDATTPRQEITHYRLTNNTRWYIKRSVLALNMAYQQNNRSEFGNVAAPFSPDLYFFLTTFNYDLRWQLPDIKGWHLTLGANGMQQSNHNNGKEVIVPEYSFFDAGAYLFFKKEWNEKLNFSGGVRFDNRSINTDNLYIDSLNDYTKQQNGSVAQKFKHVGTNFDAVTGSLGATYKFTKQFSIKLNAARGFRAPNIAEIASNGKHEGTLRYEIGDARLKPETSLQGDLGFILNADHISSELSLFYNDIQNYIFASKLESVFGGDSIADATRVYQYKQGNAFLYGGEYSIDIHPHPLDWLHIENAFSMVNAQQKNQPDSMKYLPFIPGARYQGELRCEIKKVGKILGNFYISAAFNYFFKQERIYAAYKTETATPDYGLLNFGLGGNVMNKKGNTLFTLSLSLTNALDQAYQNHLSRLKYAAINPATGRTGIYNMGRNFSVKLLIPLNFKKG